MWHHCPHIDPTPHMNEFRITSAPPRLQPCSTHTRMTFSGFYAWSIRKKADNDYGSMRGDHEHENTREGFQGRHFWSVFRFKQSLVLGLSLDESRYSDVWALLRLFSSCFELDLTMQNLLETRYITLLLLKVIHCCNAILLQPQHWVWYRINYVNN